MERGADASGGVRWLVVRVMPWSGQDGVRVERGWSKDRARAAIAQWRVEKVAQTWYQKRCIFIHIVCVLHCFQFATPCLFHFSTAAFSSLPPFLFQENVRGWKGGEEWKEMEKRRGLSEIGGGYIMKGRAEGWGMVRWKERNIFLQVLVKLLSLFWVSLEIAFRISSLKIRYPHS